MNVKSILFVCGRNAGRSQMAAAFFRKHADPARVTALSAGLDPAHRVHPNVVTVMKEAGIDLSDVTPTALTARMQGEAYFLVTLGCGERCPLVPDQRRVDWPLEDPEKLPVERVRKIRDEIERRVIALIKERGWGRTS